MLAHLLSVCLPMAKKAQFKTAVSEVPLYSKYWQLKAFSLQIPATQFRKYTEIFGLTEVITWLPKWFTAFLFICHLFQDLHGVSSNKNKESSIIGSKVMKQVNTTYWWTSNSNINPCLEIATKRHFKEQYIGYVVVYMGLKQKYYSDR